MTITSSEIEHLVFSGGGAKGIMYAGAYQALLDSHSIDSCRQVHGASAGALTATCIALGIQPHRFTQLAKTDFKQLLKRSQDDIAFFLQQQFQMAAHTTLLNLYKNQSNHLA